MKQILVLLLGCLALAASTHAAPLGTLFTYQGRLDFNGQPANGDYQMTFWLYANFGGGTPLASNIVPVVPVNDGLFTRTVDFGVNPATGRSWFGNDEAWLAITVAPVGSSTFSLLAPRARISPAPQSLYAVHAGTANAVTNGAIRPEHLNAGTPGNGQVLTFNNGSLVWQAAGATTSPWLLSGANTYFNGGNVGIGTTTPTVPLHVNSSATASSVLEALLQPNLGAGGFNQIYLGRTPTRNECGTFTYTYDGANPALSRLSLGLYNSSFSFNVLGNGNIGIGVANPLSALHVVGNWDGGQPALQLGGQKPSVVFEGGGSTGNRSWLMHVGGNGPGNLEFFNSVVGSGVWRPKMSLVNDGNFLRVEGGGGEAAYIGSDSEGGEVHMGSLNPNVNSVAIYNSGGGFWMDLSVRSLTILGGADLAEPFPMSEQSISQGSVVVIDEANPGQLKLSQQAYDTRVAGIVSGANGIKPGIALKQEGALDQGQNVALTGRVYVQADASFGAIKPGDLLTTSDTPGHAMKVNDSARAQGAILGKSMTALAEGKGLVLVLVTLQ